MSMTDGHIYFDSELFFAGRRPAIDPFLSVTRVGRQTQNPLQKDISSRLLIMLSDYEKITRFVKFGTELGENSRAILDMGEKIWQFFDQPINEIVPRPLAMVLFALLISGNFNPKNTQKAIESYDEAKIKALLDGCQTVDQLIDKINNLKFEI